MNNYSCEYLDNLIKNLKNPNILDPEERKNTSYSQSFLTYGSNFLKTMGRYAQYMEGSQYYDETNARQLVIEYINNPECTQALQPQHKKIMEIYNRLAHISKGKGSWADDIDKELLMALEPTVAAKKNDDSLIEDLDQMIARNVLLPASPNESPTDDEEELPAAETPDPDRESYVFKPIKLDPPSTTLLFHMHADEFGHSSEYEGGSSKDAVKYLHSYLQKAQATSGATWPQALIDEVGNAVNMIYDPSLHYNSQNFKVEKAPEYIKNAKQKIAAAFQSNKPILITGGWTGSPSGHAIYYEIIPASDKTASFRLYNSGAGVSNHPQANEGHKIKFQPFTEWKEIDRTLLESNDFLEALYQLNSFLTHPTDYINNEYGEKDIYEGLKEILKPAKESSFLPPADLNKTRKKSPQRSGVCSWKSLMAFVSTRMDVNSYKRFQCDIKLQSLKNYVESFNSPVTAKEWRLVKKSHQNLCAAIVRLYKEKRIGDAYIKSAQEMMAPIFQWIHKHADCRFERQIEPPVFKYIPCIEDRALENKHSLPSALDSLRKAASAADTAAQPWKNSLESMTSLNFKEPEAVEKNLEQLVIAAKKTWLDREDMTLHKGLVQTVYNLDLSEEFWEKVIAGDQKKAETLILQFGELAKLFLKSCFTIPKAPTIFPEKVYVFFKILKIQEKLCRLGHPNSLWQSAAVGLPSVHDVAGYPYLNFADAKMQREMISMYDMAPVSDKAPFIQINSYTFEHDFQGGGFSTSYESPRQSYESIGSEFKFLKGHPTKKPRNFQEVIRNEYPQVIETMAKKEAKFHQLPRYSQDARIYASDDLPEWVKAMRDTLIARDHIMGSKVGPLSSLDRTSDIEPVFQVDDKEDSSIVTISLSGVNKDILNNPEVNKIRGVPHSRYARQYRDILAAPVQQFLGRLDSHERPETEKKLLCTTAKMQKIDMADEDFKELAYLFFTWDTHKLKLVETLAYFRKHPEKLKDTDYQTLLHTLFFNNCLLDENLAVPGFEAHLSHFIQNNYEQFLHENEIQATVFLLKIAHQLHSFCPQQEVFSSATVRLKTLVERKGLEPDEKCLVYAELVAQLGHQKTLTEEEAALIVAGTIYIEENQPQSKLTEDPTTAKEIRETLLVHAKTIQSVLEKGNPNKTVLNRILRLARPELAEDREWLMKSKPNEFPVFSTPDGEHVLYPLLSRLISSNAVVLLPLNLRQNALFQQLFPGIEQGTYLPGNVFSFKDGQGRETLVHMKGDTLVIDQKLDPQKKEWSRYIPTSSFIDEVTLPGTNEKKLQSHIGSRYLVHHCTYWQSLEEKATIYAIDSKTGKAHYLLHCLPLDPAVLQKEINEKAARQKEELKIKVKAQYGGWCDETLFEHELKKSKAAGIIREEPMDPSCTYAKILDVARLSDGLKLGKPSKLFTSFEDPSYIHEWYDDKGVLKKIELPRFNLSFSPEGTPPEKVKCDQFPKFTVNTKDASHELGIYPHYILLENGKGQRKLILPCQPFKSPEKKEVLEPRYEVDRSLERDQHKPQKYFAFDVQAHGLLSSQSREANLYLAQVLATTQEYKKAACYLKKFGNKQSLYTASEAEILRNISKIKDITGDESGNGSVLRLYAGYLLIKNTLSLNQAVSDTDSGSLRSNYALYLNHYRHATVFKLKPEEEGLILKTLLAQQFEASHYLRLKELDPSAARQIQLPPVKKMAKPVKKTEALAGFNMYSLFPDFSFEANSDSWKKPEKPLFLTRSHTELKKHPFYFYNIARTGNPEEKEKLKHSLGFVRTAEGGQHAETADLFEAVLENPKAFPSPPNNLSTLNDNEKGDAKEKWRETVKEIAIKQWSSRPSQASQMKETDIAHVPVRLDEKQPPLKSLPIVTKLPVLPSLAEETKKSGCFKPDIPQPDTEETQSLSDLLKSFAGEDPVEKAEIARLTADLVEYRKKPPAPSYTLSAQGLSRVKEILSQNKNKDLAEIQALLNKNTVTPQIANDMGNWMTELEKEILNQANKDPEDPIQIAKNQLEKWTGLRKVITLEELLVCFAQQDFSKLQRNPALKETDMAPLAKNIGMYMLYATRNQKRAKVETVLKKLDKLNAKGNGNTDEYSDLVNQLAQEMLSDRSYEDFSKYPAFLVFEYFANIWMRPAQVKKLETFLKEGNINLIMEMIMGSGKSKVLLPLLGFLRADGHNLSMLVVPKPLFESISQDTQSILRDAFSQSLHSIHFDRNTPFTKECLQRILDEMSAIQANKECLIMTSKSVQCLLLKFIEECHRHFKIQGGDSPLSDELKILQKILLTFKESGYPIIDEADTILNVLHEVSFSGGRRLPPKTHELELLSEIYSLVYEDPAIKALAHVESDPQAVKEAPVLTEPLYQDTIKAPLAKALVQRLGKMTFGSKPLTNKVHKFIDQLDEDSRNTLLHYLCRDAKHIDSAQAYYDGLDEEIQDVLAFAGEQISHLLPYTLTRNCDVNYGLDENNGTVFAIPFSAANNPNCGSQFSNPHITMNYTFQTYVKKGITREMVENQVLLLQEKAMREMAAQGGKISLKDTEAGNAFNKLKGPVDMPLFKYKPAHIEAIVKYINGNAEAKRAFVSYQILPQMELFENKMSCNPHHLAALFNKISGFTGTLWNGLSMHHKLKPEPELGTDAKTLSLLWKHSRTNAVSIKEGAPKEMLRQLKEKSIDFDLISDSGGYFKQGTHAETAHEIVASEGKETVFYNDDGEQTITSESGNVPLVRPAKSPEKRKTFLDQSHTIGADVPQKRNAVSLVTIGRNMLLRDLLQGVWRLRGLDKSQRVRFLVSDEVAGIIRQKLKLPDGSSIQLDAILKFAIANQAVQQGLDNYKALREELLNIPQQILLKALLQENLHPKARSQAFKTLISTWIKSAFYSSKELYGNLAAYRPKDSVLASDKKQSLTAIKDIFEKMPWLEQLGITQKACVDEVGLLIERIQNALPSEIQSPAKEIENDQTVEMEKETNTRSEKQTQLEVQESTSSKIVELSKVYIDIQKKVDIKVYDSFDEAVKGLKRCLSYSNDDYILNNTLPVFSLKSYLEGDKNLKEYASAFEGIYLSMNVLEWTYRPKEFALLGSQRSDFQHLIVNGSQVTLLSHADASPQRSSPDYFHLNLGFNDPAKKPTADQLYKITKLKFLSGESQYDQEELKLLKQWFKSQGTQKMQKLFLEYILKGYPKKAARYLDSPLQKLFATA